MMGPSEATTTGRDDEADAVNDRTLTVTQARERYAAGELSDAELDAAIEQAIVNERERDFVECRVCGEPIGGHGHLRSRDGPVHEQCEGADELSVQGFMKLVAALLASIAFAALGFWQLFTHGFPIGYQVAAPFAVCGVLEAWLVYVIWLGPRDER